MCEKFVWPFECKKLLIEKLELYPQLWDTKSKDYRNKVKKRSALKSLGELLNVSEEEIRKKIHILRTQFLNELKKTKQRKSEQGPDEIYSSKWEFFNAMQFMFSSAGSKEEKDDNLLALKCKYNGSEQNVNEANNSSSSLNISTKSPRVPNKRKRKENYQDPNDFIIKQALEAIQTRSDEHQIFGDYIASELRSFKKDSSRKKLKRLIQQSILKVSEEDENDFI